MGNIIPFERVMGPNRNNMENDGYLQAIARNMKPYYGSRVKTFLLASSLRAAFGELILKPTTSSIIHKLRMKNKRENNVDLSVSNTDSVDLSIWRSISMRAGPASLQFEWSKAGLGIDLPVFVYYHTKTILNLFSRQGRRRAAFMWLQIFLGSNQAERTLQGSCFVKTWIC